MWPTAVGIVLLVAGLEFGDACSCQASHIQTHFCRSDYVMLIRLKKHAEKVYSKVKTYDADTENETRTNHFKEIKYRVHINRIFQLKDNEAGLRKNSTAAVIYTPPNDGLCGVYLDRNTKYLIGGQIRGPQVTLSLCDLVKAWKLVSKRQRRNLITKYGENCHCQIQNWYQELDTGDKCTWPRTKQRHCYERASACIANKNSVTGGCKWHRNHQLRLCKAEARKPRLP